MSVIHIGWPWTGEMIAVAYKQPNGLIGTDHPLINLCRVPTEFGVLGLCKAAHAKIMRDNTIRLYGLDLPLSTADLSKG